MENSLVLQLSNLKFQDLSLCFCGHSECSPLHKFGPAVRPNYIIHYVLSGKGYYNVNGAKYTLTKNYGFLIEPNTQTFYQADSKTPWTYLWIGFSGTQAEKYLNEIGLNHNNLVFKNNHSNELKNIILKILKNNNLTLKEDFYRQGLLYEFFSTLMDDTYICDSINSKTNNLYIQKSIIFIKNNYSIGINVSDIAKYLNISRSYLYTLFNQTLGISPKDYLSNFRLTRAAELLTITENSIDNICISCGYNNPEVFSSAFKAKFCLTPIKYRKLNKSTQKDKLDKEIQYLDSL